MSKELPQYKCHKVVRAAKVAGIEDREDGPYVLLEGGYDAVPAKVGWNAEHMQGWYLVFYDDGYYSGSPAKAFEEGYTLVSEAPRGTDQLLQFFAYAHLPPHLQAISGPFGELAQRIVDTLPRNPERTVALRKLLEAKDCAVRANLWKDG